MLTCLIFIVALISRVACHHHEPDNAAANNESETDTGHSHHNQTDHHGGHFQSDHHVNFSINVAEGNQSHEMYLSDRSNQSHSQHHHHHHQGDGHQKTVVAVTPIQNRGVVEAIAVLRSTENVTGHVLFKETGEGGENSTSLLQITGQICGLQPGHHGMHVHQFGNLMNGCLSTAGHFNPGGHHHGGQSSGIRHAGDLGNVLADETGCATVNVTDEIVSLNGPWSIIGRALMIHAEQDDSGLGGDHGSLTTGNAGGRIACGVIGIAKEL